MTDREESHEPSVGYLSLLRRVAGRWRLSLGIFVAVALPVAVWAVAFLPKSYEAVATIFIEDPKRGNTGYFREWMPANDASFQQALLRSRSLAEAVVENLPRESVDELLGRSMHRDYVASVQSLLRRARGHEPLAGAVEQRAVSELQTSRVRFVSLPSGEVEVRAVAYQPRVAMDIANTYVGVLQTRSRSHLRDEARATRKFIETLMTQTKAGLQEAEEAATKMGRGRGLRGAGRSSFEMAQLAQLESALADIQASREIAAMRLAALKGGKPVAGLPASRARNERLVALESKLAGLQERYTDEHPLVRATQAEIRDLKAGFAGGSAPAGVRPSAAPSAADQAATGKQIAELELELASLQTREDMTKQRIARVSANLASLGGDDTEGAKVMRRVEAQRNLLVTLTEKLGTATVQEQGDDRGLRVIDLATLPAGPTNTPAKKMISLGVLLGLVLGVGVAAVIEYFNQPIETEEDILNVANLPVLGWLPTVPAMGGGARNGGRPPLSFVDGVIPDSLPVEGCRSIRTSLEALHGAQTLKTIMVASAGPSEGKSTVTVNLGWVFWELGRRLILIDADLRRPALHQALRQPVKTGLADVLAGRARCEDVGQTIRERFVLLPAGKTDVKPGVLLRAEHLQPFLEEAKTRADFVLIDSAPVLAVADNLILSSLVDGVIMVVRAGHTQRRDLLRAKDAIEKAGGRLLGVVLNQLSPRETRRYYGRYGAYYGHSDDVARPWWRRYRPWSSGEKEVA
jgi:capsular exopolysaccharide synthesis family protein